MTLYIFYFNNKFYILGGNQNITKEGDHGHSAVEYDKSDNLSSDDDDDAMEQLILAQCIKVAWAEKGTSKVAPFRHKVILGIHI